MQKKIIALIILGVFLLSVMFVAFKSDYKEWKSKQKNKIFYNYKTGEVEVEFDPTTDFGTKYTTLGRIADGP